VTADAKAATDDWTAAGAYPVAPGVHRVTLPLPTDGLRAVNVYVVEDDGGLVLIDSGWALEQARTALTSALGALGAGLGDVRSLPGDTADWEAPDRWLTPHQEIGVRARTLTAIATPGHTWGHMVFRVPVVLAEKTTDIADLR